MATITKVYVGSFTALGENTYSWNSTNHSTSVTVTVDNGITYQIQMPLEEINAAVIAYAEMYINANHETVSRLSLTATEEVAAE